MADANLNEIRQRLTRVESRICRIADFLGAPVGDPKKALEIQGKDTEYPLVHTPVMDVTLSELIQLLHSAGITGKVVDVQFGGRIIAAINT